MGIFIWMRYGDKMLFSLNYLKTGAEIRAVLSVLRRQRREGHSKFKPSLVSLGSLWLARATQIYLFSKITKGIMPVVPILRRWRQKNEVFKVVAG